MNILKRIIIFVVGFSGVFYLVRTNDYYNSKILLADLGGIPWLYSTIGVIFSIIAAFAIQKEWDNWNNLVEAEKNEVDSLEELWIWAEHLPENIGKKIKESIIEYIKVVINEGWQKSEKGERSEAAEQAILSLRYTLFINTLQNNPQLLRGFSSSFTNLSRYRKRRLHFSTRYTPNILRHALIFSMCLLISLSLLIGIKNIWLDYIFTLSIATLVYIIYIVVIDLDHPLQPGGWHLTTKDYKELLQKIGKFASHPSENYQDSAPGSRGTTS
jgi:hypothetical protein